MNKRNILLVSAILSFFFISNLVYAIDLRVYWKFDDSGITATDSSGNGYDGTLFHNAYFNTTNGKYDGSLQLPDYTGYMQSNSNIGIGTTFSISAWVNPSLDIQNSYSRIIENDYGSSFYLGTDLTGTQYQFIVNANINDIGNVIAGTISSNSWIYLTATYDGTIARLYINGLEVANETLIPPYPVSTKIYVAKGESGFIGGIDEVTIFDRALTQSEIQNIYQYNVYPSNIIIPANVQYSYYCLDNTSYENKTGAITSIQCQYGCSNSNPIAYYQGRTPQGDKCNSSPFYNNLLSIGIFTGFIIGAIFLYKTTKKQDWVGGILFLILFVFTLILWNYIPEQLELLSMFYFVIPIIYGVFSLYLFFR
jgi:hypothetical protein